MSQARLGRRAESRAPHPVAAPSFNAGAKAEARTIMKFLERHYIAINDAFAEFCETHADVVEAAKRKPDELEEPARYVDWVGSEYEQANNSAVRDFVGLFSAGKLTPIVLHHGKELRVPDEYWQKSFADLTFARGSLCGLATNDEYQHLDGCPVVLLREEWDSWKSTAGKSPAEQGVSQTSRMRHQSKDKVLENRIRSVLAAARTKWSYPSRRLSTRQMAKELERLDRLERDQGKRLGYRSETIRKILDGSYPALKRFGLSGI